MVELPQYDYAAAAKQAAAHERKLLKLARDRKDEAAADELLLRFSRGIIADAYVLGEIVDGCREVAAYVVNKTILRADGELFRVSPLMYFSGVATPPKTGGKNKLAKRLDLLATYEDRESFGYNRDAPLLTLGELKEALTTKLSAEASGDEGVQVRKPMKRKDWPPKMHQAEDRLVDYIRWKHDPTQRWEPLGREECVRYIHASFGYEWSDRDASFPYPQNWK